MASNELLDSSLKERLWHRLRQDLARFAPDRMDDDHLMCCACGRFLPYDDLSLEHIIPKQALSDDPIEVKTNPLGTKNIRAGTTLLCRKPLLIKEKTVYQNGCNSWKGKFYDSAIREILNGRAQEGRTRRVTNQHIIAMLCAAYLAMVQEFGYQVVLIQSGLLMRQQFFMPNSFHKHMPMSSQIMLSAPPPTFAEEDKNIWLNPFNFHIDGTSCVVTFRTHVIRLPISRDPRVPIAQHLAVRPSKYKLRPDFRTVFT